MSDTIDSQRAPAALAAPPAVSAPRKRRRRAPTTGAADDCFACRKKNMKCDRRRPYCSQCIDQGKECSGYKTQLTWGVGVASRGKLRGLSVPVVRKDNVVTASSNKSRASFSSNTGRREMRKSASPEMEDVPPRSSSITPSAADASTPFDFTSADGSIPSSASGKWQLSHSNFMDDINMVLDSNNKQPYLRQVFQHMPYIGSMDDLSLSTYASSTSNYSDSDYPSPSDYPQSPDDIAYLSGSIPLFDYGSLPPPFSSLDSSLSNSIHSDGRGPTSYPAGFVTRGSMSSSISSEPSSYDFMEINSTHTEPAGSCDVAQPLFNDQVQGGSSGRYKVEMGPGSFISSRDVTKARGGLESSASVLPGANDRSFGLSSVGGNMDITIEVPQENSSISAGQGLTPRMRVLFDYYERVICPNMVAFDGPNNPYRSSILALAKESEALQHAIAALVLSNLRTKHRNDSLSSNFNSETTSYNPPPTLSHSNRDPAPPYPANTSSPATKLQEILKRVFTENGPTDEELDHKQAAIRLLNADLVDPSKSQNDSTLATLFVLCLYHMCERGIAQFKTQFAGVKRILSMRKNGVEHNKWGWMETLFTWFDAMTATTNDREAQLRGGYFDMVALSFDEAGLENLAGCDGRLFKIIGKLGRLNLLSQGKPVLDPLEDLPCAAELKTAISQGKLAGRASWTPSYDLDGYFSPHQCLPHQATSPYERVPRNNENRNTANEDDNGREQFWKEWREMHHALQSWCFDPTAFTPPSTATSPSNNRSAQRDLYNISEAFRHSALLYIKRLASPHLASSDFSFQTLVETCLHHLTAIPADSPVQKFLLWPLFITGTETISSHQRSFIRQGCLDIQKKSGFFNNISGLEVLERIWAEEDEEGSSRLVSEDTEKRIMMQGGRGFKWRKLIEEADGEYILI